MTEVFTALDKELALKSLVTARKELREATGAYKNAIATCAEMGITNVKMAQELGLTETAVRMTRKRMEKHDY